MIGFAPTGDDYDFFAYDEDGDVWNINDLAYETPYNVDFTEHRIPAVETAAGSGRFTADAPAGMATYELRVREVTLGDSHVFYEGSASSSGGGATTQNVDITEQEAS